MTPEDLLNRILRDERLLDLAAAVVAAASETMVEAKIRALGRALATGALAADDAVVDEQRFLVDILDDLEAPHVRMLHQLSIQHEGMDRLEMRRGRSEHTAG
jgi:chloramphenicol 3-O-phosphotransferase